MTRLELPIVKDSATLQGVEREATTVPFGERWELAEGRVDLLSLDIKAMKELMAELGEKPFRAQQIFRWLHEKQVTSFEEMTDLKKALRAALEERCALIAPRVADVKVSADGTRKYQLETWDGHVVEAVYIPDASAPGKNALCISSQVGCAMGCTFCATASLKLTRHLTPGEIVGQYHAVCRDLAAAGLTPPPEGGGKAARPVTNIVYMGMGEPLHNYRGVVGSIRLFTDERGPYLAPKRLTVSTSGIVPAIERLGQDTDVHLAISLNGSFDEGRRAVMPVNKRWGLEQLMAACRAFPLKRHRRITFEYVLLGGENDTEDDAHRVADLLAGIPTKVNLIPFNAHPLSPFRRPEAAVVAAFQRVLQERGLAVYVRTTRGDDIDAACGMLGAKKLEAARGSAG